MAFEMIDYKHYGSCACIGNDEIEVLITADIGPRIIAYRFKNGTNMFGEFGPEMQNETELGIWHPWGGHRLWHAPEAKPRSYSPDNSPVKVLPTGDYSACVSQAVEPATGIKKDIIITLDSYSSAVKVEHRLTNTNLWNVNLAPWALTIMRPGGKTIVPQEPFIPHTEKLLPARPLVLWNYTDLSDPRWHFGKRLFTLTCDENIDTPQKIGACNKLGWAAYLVDRQLFIKKFPYVDGQQYPDYGCNFETFTNADFMEIETLGHCVELLPNEAVEHVESWYLFDGIEADDSEESLCAAILPIVENLP